MPEHNNSDKFKTLLSLTMIFCIVMLFAGAARSSVPTLEDRWRGLIVVLFSVVALVLAGVAAWNFMPIWVERYRIYRRVKQLEASGQAYSNQQGAEEKFVIDLTAKFASTLQEEDTESAVISDIFLEDTNLDEVETP
jgi:hypothetical protein